MDLFGSSVFVGYAMSAVMYEIGDIVRSRVASNEGSRGIVAEIITASRLPKYVVKWDDGSRNERGKRGICHEGAYQGSLQLAKKGKFSCADSELQRNDDSDSEDCTGIYYDGATASNDNQRAPEHDSEPGR